VIADWLCWSAVATISRLGTASPWPWAADAAKALAKAPGDKKVALFTDNEPDSVVERPLCEAAFKAAGLDVVGDYTFPVGTTDFSPFIAAAKANGAELVAGQLAPADGAALAKKLASSAFHPKAALLAGSAGYAPAALGYAVAEVLTDALTAAGSVNPARLNAAIGHTDAPTTAGRVTFSQFTHTAITAYRVTG
jgi:branched-chain amino acid transport system substrate-binding protein